MPLIWEIGRVVDYDGLLNRCVGDPGAKGSNPLSPVSGATDFPFRWHPIISEDGENSPSIWASKNMSSGAFGDVHTTW